MTTQDYQRYRDLLLDIEHEMRQDASAMEDQTRQSTGGQADGGLSNTPMHLADLGTDVSQQQTSSKLLDNERYLLGEIRAALQRLDSGTFGRCITCDKPIGRERIQAIPYASQCIDCAEKSDGHSSVDANSRDFVFERSQRLDSDRSERQDRVPASYPDIEAETIRQSNSDVHAAGTAGGGTAMGGLAGTNFGRGDPNVGDLERATGSGEFDIEDRFAGESEESTPIAGLQGGVIAGTSASKRTGSVKTKKNTEKPNAGKRTSPKNRRNS